ncbi:exodeoxyribonuclease III [Dipodascopsis tothii]|uniref:exodeoxyribonuclease III n=1 Tax=Dipodascopsis tothii TaxID=44089 RepID=UPI0034CF4312
MASADPAPAPVDERAPAARSPAAAPAAAAPAAGPPAAGAVRLVSFNVCGLRNVLFYHPWNEHKTFEAMFDLLAADIVCFQEVKMQRQDITASMAMVAGYDAYFSLPRHKKGYSGVAVFVRHGLPVVRAEEGLTGVLPCQHSGKPFRDLNGGIGGYDRTLSSADALALDSEGRALVLDLGAFVLFGLYCPASSAAADRQSFRLFFLETLDRRVRSLVAAGRRVVVMGDINVIRDRIDTAEPSPPDEPRSAAAAIVDSLLQPAPDAVLVDVCREHHPTRTGMYTCWNQKLNARPGNVGSRIDYIMVSPELAAATRAADIRPDLGGSDHCPVYADIDRAVFADVPQDTALAIGRSLAAKSWSEFNRRDIAAMFRAAPQKTARPVQPAPPAAKAEPKAEPMAARSATPPARLAKPPVSPARGLKRKDSGQSRLTAFVKRVDSKAGPALEPATTAPAALPDVQPAARSESASSVTSISSTPPFPSSAPASTASPADQKAAWKQLFAKPETPQCEHGLPAIKLVTRKPGINEGRAFWICSKYAVACPR